MAQGLGDWPTPMSAIIDPIHRRWFFFACLFETSLVGIATGLGWLLHHQPGADLHLHFVDGLIGCLATFPPLGFFIWMCRATPAPLAKVQDFLEEVVRPFFKGWSLAELALISVLAGISEEWLFRGAVQGGLSKTLGQPLALVVASVAFGLCHLVNWTYAFAAACIGAYLGVVWLQTGNLLTPIITHALYDFLALTCLLRLGRGHMSGPPDR